MSGTILGIRDKTDKSFAQMERIIIIFKKTKKPMLFSASVAVFH